MSVDTILGEGGVQVQTQMYTHTLLLVFHAHTHTPNLFSLIIHYRQKINELNQLSFPPRLTIETFIL